MSSEYDIEVTLSCPGIRVGPGIEVTAIPIDRDALRDSIADASGLPRPSFADLDSALASYEPADLSGLGESLAPWRSIYDSVRHLADSLNSVDPARSSGYSLAYGRLRDQYQRLAQATVQRDDALRDLIGDDKDLAMRAAAAADSLRAWEGAALALYPELADSAIAQSGRMTHTVVSDEQGAVTFTLEPGRWWFVARCSDPDNPFMEYYWNIAHRVRWIGAKSLILSEANGLRRWRY